MNVIDIITSNKSGRKDPVNNETGMSRNKRLKKLTIDTFIAHTS